MNPFTFVNSINYSKEDVMVDDLLEDSYNSYYTNRSLSYFRDTVAAANVMNQYWTLDKKLQYHFLINIVRRRKRFSKWIKPEIVDDLEAVKEYYGYNNQKAQEALSLLSTDDINEIRRRIYKGGRI